METCKGKDDLLLIPQNECMLLLDHQECEIREENYFKNDICPFIESLCIQMS